MTSEKRTFLELSDVLGVEVECPTCKFGAFFPTEKTQKIPAFCPQCNATWFDDKVGDYGKTTYPAIDSLLNVSAELRSLTHKDRKDIHTSVRIRVNVE